MNGNWYMRSPEVLSRTAGPEVILAVAGRDDVDRLSDTAGTIWRLLETPQTVRSLVEALTKAYDGPRDEIASDVERLLDELLDRSLVECVADGDD